MPPLLATIAATIVAAGFILVPSDMAQFGRSAVAALFSVSNFVFYAEAGYWDTASELKPLLHTWSLGVEEQFYLFWPAMLLVLIKVSKQAPLWLTLGLISLLGGVLCIWYSGVDQAAAFYLFPFRIFQFSLGALIVPLIASVKPAGFISSRQCASILFTIGMALLLTSLVVIDEKTLFPGYAVLLPTIGTMLVLMAGALVNERGRVATWLLENPVSTWLGKVSYSMYLAHWPVISLYHYHSQEKFSVSEQLVLFAVILALTCALHYLVEKRFYARAGAKGHVDKQLSDGVFALRVFATSLCIGFVSVSAWVWDGWEWRHIDTALTAQQIADGKSRRFDVLKKTCGIPSLVRGEDCRYGARTQVLILGNSHEPDGLNFIDGGYGSNDVNLIPFGTINGCDNLHGKAGRFYSDDNKCQEKLDVLFADEMIEQIDVVIYAANKPYAANKEPLLKMLEVIKARRPEIRVITFGGYINTKRECSYYILAAGSSEACTLEANVSYFADSPSKEPLFDRFKVLESHYIDRVDLLCHERKLTSCLTKTGDGIPMFYDSHHNSLEFAVMSGRLYQERFPNLLGRHP